MLQILAGGFTLDDTVLLDGRVVRKAPGGNVLYAAVGAALAGAQPALLAPVGRDYPQENLDALAKAGFLLDGCPRLEAPCLRIWALHEGPNRRQLVNRLDSGTNEQLDPRPQHVPPHYLEASSFHVASIPVGTQEALVGFFSPTGMVVSLDAPHVPLSEAERRALEALLANVTVFLPSREEVEAIWSSEPSLETCRRLGALGPEVVAIKMGDEGSFVWSRSFAKAWRVPVYGTQSIDVTGAGDAYCGAFCATYTRTRDPRKAAVSGTVAASFVVENLGGLHALGTAAADVKQRAADVDGRVWEVDDKGGDAR